MSRLLILSCSKRKRDTEAALPAIELYDGPAFRVLRRYLRASPPDPPQVWILSAEHGLVPRSQPISPYDRRMDPQRAAVLRPAITAALENLRPAADGPPGGHPWDVLVCAGRSYAEAMPEWLTAPPPTASVRWTRGSQGRRLSQLKAWLWSELAGGNGDSQPSN
jgi:hypothetical protein